MLTTVFRNVCPRLQPFVIALFPLMIPPISKCPLHSSWMTLWVQKSLIKQKTQIYGEGTWKISDTSLLQPSRSVGERTGPRRISSGFAPTSGFQSLPSPHAPQHFNLSISLLPSSSPVYAPFLCPCLIFSFFLIAPFSHTHIPSRIIFLLEPVLMASFQEQQV